MSRRYFAIALLLCAFMASYCSAAPISAAAALDRVKSKGSTETLFELYGNGDNNTWQSVTAGIASGSRMWLEVARQLFPAADAGAASELLDSVSLALRKSPERVLSIIYANQADWHVVCSGPPGDGAPNNYFRDAMIAVKRVRNPKLQRIKVLCLGLLDEAAKSGRK